MENIRIQQASPYPRAQLKAYCVDTDKMCEVKRSLGIHLGQVWSVNEKRGRQYIYDLQVIDNNFDINIQAIPTFLINIFHNFVQTQF